MNCPKCNYQMSDTDLTCPRCAIAANTVSIHIDQPILQRSFSGAKFLGLLMLVGGLIGMCYFMFQFDTSIATNITPPPGMDASMFPSRVNNLGLLADRQNGIVVSGIVAVLGLILALFGPKAARQ